MTIGDEKVQRFEPRMIGIEDRPPEAGMYASLHGQYVLHSAYAEMAAELASYKADTQKLREILGNSPAAKLVIELDTVRAEKKAAESQLAEERELRMSLESSWQQAEAQLAELRGKCERLVDRWANDSNYSFYECEHDLRTLAAADGG